MSLAKLTARLKRDFQPILANEGLDLEDVLIQAAGKRQVVRILVDKDDGITLDDVAAATKRLSSELDRSNAMGERSYVLEVSSPGVGRPLTEERHWRRNTGRLVRIVFQEESEPLVGRIVAVAGADVVIEAADAGGEMTVARSGMRKAVVQVEMNNSEGAGPSDKGRK
ncbi:MAG: ribosome maturation factor RimP [Actinomycetia bacterium]|nr:ribosome maturation factor RimP [Actinomycetes bacterium]